jgi:hypothetical protein
VENEEMAFILPNNLSKSGFGSNPLDNSLIAVFWFGRGKQPAYSVCNWVLSKPGHLSLCSLGAVELGSGWEEADSLD